MSNHMYIVSFFNLSFRSLEDAKWNVKIALSRNEAIKYLSNTNEEIYHYIGEKLVSKTPIHVDEAGNITFGRTSKVV